MNRRTPQKSLTLWQQLLYFQGCSPTTKSRLTNLIGTLDSTVSTTFHHIYFIVRSDVLCINMYKICPQRFPKAMKNDSSFYLLNICREQRRLRSLWIVSGCVNLSSFYCRIKCWIGSTTIDREAGLRRWQIITKTYLERPFRIKNFKWRVGVHLYSGSRCVLKFHRIQCTSDEGRCPAFLWLKRVKLLHFDALSLIGQCFFLQNDPNKQTNMPTDGTVHELTSNVSNLRLQQTPISGVVPFVWGRPFGLKPPRYV